MTKLRTTAGTSYYIAPEVLSKNYDEKCDVWSCGVILYILLSGSPPFNGKDDNAILEAVKQIKFSYKGIDMCECVERIWNSVSSAAKDLINNMIKYPPERRFTAQEALEHKWLKNKEFNRLEPEMVESTMMSLKNFQVVLPVTAKTKQKLEQATLMYIATQLVNKEEKEKLKETFMALDKNADGKLSREELLEGYVKLYGSKVKAEVEVDNIMANVDIDNNGYIDYSGMLCDLYRIFACLYQ
eukprot:TRINITY_DN9610_c0_g1_i8.p1 TRINITY_DN9610_c0_g1~~TRINITY_DN9610_c0_g1_i8.p1  ORF type:complete len:242 (+),score=42.48 TRINITY_DN9610_c0_g1_i8:147-872(+)